MRDLDYDLLATKFLLLYPELVNSFTRPHYYGSSPEPAGWTLEYVEAQRVLGVDPPFTRDEGSLMHEAVMKARGL